MITTSEFIAMLKKAGIQPREYSGRFMFGAFCVGATTDHEYGLIARVIASNPEHALALADILNDTKTDGMGRGVILYWPKLKLVSVEDFESLH